MKRWKRYKCEFCNLGSSSTTADPHSSENENYVAAVAPEPKTLDTFGYRCCSYSEKGTNKQTPNLSVHIQIDPCTIMCRCPHSANLDLTHLERNFEILQEKLADIHHHETTTKLVYQKPCVSSSSSSCSSTVDSTNTNTDPDSFEEDIEEEISTQSIVNGPVQPQSQLCHRLSDIISSASDVVVATNLPWEEDGCHPERIWGVDPLETILDDDDDTDEWNIHEPPASVLPPPTPTDDWSVAGDSMDDDVLLDTSDYWNHRTHNLRLRTTFHCDEHYEIEEVNEEEPQDHTSTATRRIWPPVYQFYASIFHLKLQLYSPQNSSTLSTHRCYSSLPLLSLFCQ
jgi:hypothetical protein